MALKDDVETQAAKAKRLKSEDFEKENRPISELIEADRYLTNRGKVTGNSRKICINKLRPPGST